MARKRASVKAEIRKALKKLKAAAKKTAPAKRKKLNVHVRQMNAMLDCTGRTFN